MKNIKKNLSVLLYLISLLSFTHAVAAPDENALTTKNHVWNLKSVDIHTLINEVSKETGKSFILSPKVNGKVTFISNRPLSTEELYQTFLALLDVNGFIAIKSGPAIKITTKDYAKEESSDVITNVSPKSNNEMAVTTVHVKYASAVDLVNALRQLVFHFGYIEAYKPSNDIIIADSTNNIARILTLIKRLDKPFTSDTDVIRVQYAQASDLVSILSSLLQQKNANVSNITMSANDRTNAILVRGATQEQRSQIKSLINELDVPYNKKNLSTEVIYLKYLRAQRVAVVLKNLIENLIREKQLATGQPTLANLPKLSEQSAPTNTNSEISTNPMPTSMPNAPTGTGSNSTNTSVDFSNMTQKQPSSGSEGPYVQWEESTNAIVVSAPADIMAKLKSVVAKLDIKRPQVLIEAVIAEVEVDHARELGIELNTGGKVQILSRFKSVLPMSGIGNNENIALSNPATPDSIGQGLSFAYSRGNDIRLLLRALENDSRSNILSTPNILTLDNEPAQIKVGQRISFSIGQIQNNPTGGNPFNFFDQQDVGLILTINPQITPDGSIKLIIQQELSNILPGQISAGSNPNLSERFIHTTVMAKNGDILVLGGLIQNEWQDNVEKVPVLGDIPGIGVLFRSHEKQLKKQNLMVFLRPSILYDENETMHMVGSKYESLRQQQLATEKDITAQNKMNPPVLPTWNHEVVLPPPLFF